MKLEVKIQLLKFCSAVFNSIYLVLGLSVGGCAIWILFDKENFLAFLSSGKCSAELHTVSVGLLVIGAVVTVVSAAGCVGAGKELRVLLLMYLGFLIILVLGQLYITLLLLINRNKIEQSLDEAVDQFIFQYGETSVDSLMDNMQHYGRCCGRTAPADWLRNSYIQSLNLTNPDVLPCSCFSWNRPSFNSSWCSELLNFTEPLFGRGHGLYDEGCTQKLHYWLQENSLTIVGMDISLLLIQVLQFAVTVCLFRAFGRRTSLIRTDHLADVTASGRLDDGELNYTYDDDTAHLAYHHDNQNHIQVYLEPDQECQ